ncbi:type I polyketide synthase [Kutzneria buriramensis]|uniref:Acyl transferase domain-containing protein n=1 Tax=Kutzneria buriramensis TaxID=1045776 RepID=A0A3E0GZH9_9PSEU|nr:type I polyketide synthase [Kutzneria buriramensis]REH35346.1 acyl transferase domain-containing protein [Kutzneria buriramensis]
MAGEDKLREYLKRVTVDLATARRRMADADARAHEPVAVIGMSCRFPDAPDVAAYWDMLRAGRAAEITDFPRGRFDHDPGADDNTLYTPKTGAFLPDVAGWDAEFFGFPPREALRMDPQQRMLMELAWEAMEDAGTPPKTLAGSRTGVLLGFSDAFQYGQLEHDREGDAVYTDPYMGQGSLGSVVAGRIAYHFDLHGPTFSLDTACSSSLVAVHLAVQALRNNECDYVLVGGGYLALHEFLYIYSCSNALLADRCNTFDAGANGYMMGEGGGMVLLTRLSDAERHGHRVRAVIRGTAVNQDGRSNGLTAPNRSAQVDVIRRAHAAAQVTADDIAFVEAHGSGTALGDEIELGALNDVFGKRTSPVQVGAVKTNVGHTHTAAGIAGLIKTILVLENRQVPPNLNMSEPAEAVAASETVRPATALTELPDKAIAGVSSFGWSGTNAHVILEAAEAPARTEVEGLELLPVTGASENALRDRLDALSGQDVQLADLANTLQVARTHHEYRRAVVATDAADAKARFAMAEPAVRAGHEKPKVAFLLPGVGDQYRGLGRALYQHEPVFAATVDECLAIAGDRCGVDLREMFFAEPPAEVQVPSLFGGGPSDDVMDHAEIAHPFLFTIEYALAKLLEHRGVKPDLLVGYSLGEYVAACIAGVFTLSDALWVVTERARLIESAPAGRMLAAAAGPDQLTDLPVPVDIAALNGPQMTVLSGSPTDIDVVSQHLRANGIAARVLRSAHPFHSTLLQPMQDKLAALIATVERRAPRISIISNATGTVLTAGQATDPQYWADHLCKPVRFAESVQNFAADTYVELGPGQTLGGLVRQNITGRPTVLGTLPAPWPAVDRPDENVSVLETCGRLWEIGVDLDWSAFRRGGRLVSLPPYPFQRTRYWPQATEKAQAVPSGGLLYSPIWRTDLTRAELGELAGTLVVFADDSGVGGRLADIAEAAGMRVVEVAPGTGRRRDGRRVVIDPTVPELYREILAADGPVQVVHLWSLLADSPDTAIASGFDTLLLTVQALAGTAKEHGVRLLTVSSGSSEIVGGDTSTPYRSIVHGLGRGVRAEYPGLTWRGVDLQPDADPLESARRLAEELRRGPWSYEDAAAEPALVGWRNGRRWLKGYAEITPASEPDWAGTYLITGGTRGLGLLLAKHLAGQGVSKLALVSRGGGEVPELPDALVIKADVGDPDQFRSAIAQAQERFGRIDGIVHAAGVPGSGLAQRQTLADAHAVLAPKVRALDPIAELIASETPPRRVILYSSVSTVLGGLGEGDYCAANTVLDAYGTALASTSDTQVVTVVWGHWQYDAWQDGSEATADRAAYRRRNGFSDAAGLAMLDRIVGGVHGTVVAMRQELPAAQREWTALSNLAELVETAATPETTARFPRPPLRTDYAPPRGDLETTIAEIWGEFLGIDRIGVNDPFFDLGGTSLVGMAMVTAIEKVVGRPIAPAVLFAHPTVAAFAAELTEPDQPKPVVGVSRGERRRRARQK